MSRVHPLLAAAALCVPGIILAAPRPDANGAAVKRGVDAWQAGDYTAAVAAWRAPAAAGDADAQFNMAQAYKLGRGAPADMREAEGWYRKAAAQGHEQAQATLGLVMFQNGDRAGAMPWLAKAADGGEARAQYVYGTALFNGDTVPKDWPRAYAMMTRAAASGLPQARASLAQMDQFVPMAQRQQGLTLATAPVTRPAAGTTTVAPPLRPAPAPVRTATTATATQPMPAATPRPAPPVAKPVAPPKPVQAARPTPAPQPAPVAKPVPAPVRAAAPTQSAAGGWRVQFGAFGTRAAAQGAWRSLAGKPGLRGLTPIYVLAGPVVRLQAGPLAGKAAAQAACRAAGTTCFPVAP